MPIACQIDRPIFVMIFSQKRERSDTEKVQFLGGYFTCITKFFESEICVGCPLSLILLLFILAIIREIGNHEDCLCLL